MQSGRGSSGKADAVETTTPAPANASPRVSGRSMSPSTQRTPAASRRARVAGSERAAHERPHLLALLAEPVAHPLAELARGAHHDDVTGLVHAAILASAEFVMLHIAFAAGVGGTCFLDICTGHWFDPAMPDATPLHPLDPLTAEEMAAAMATLRREHALSERTLVISIALVEPDKATLRAHSPGAAVARTAAIVLVDCVAETTCEATVSLTEDRLLDFHVVEGQQAAIIGEEYEACEQLVKAHPDFVAALERRGITDQSLVCVDPIPAGAWGGHARRAAHLPRPGVGARVSGLQPVRPADRGGRRRWST